MLIDGVEFDTDTFSKMATNLQEAGTSPAEIRRILEEFKTRTLSETTADDSYSDSWSSNDDSLSDEDDDDGDYGGGSSWKYLYASSSDEDFGEYFGGVDDSSDDSDYEYVIRGCKHTREDIIHILRGMRINITPDTQLGTRLLSLGLSDALKSAQSNVQPLTTLEANTLPLWNREESVAEAFNMARRKIPLQEFFDVREGVAHRVITNWSTFLELVEKDGIDTVWFADEEHLQTLGVKILSVWTFDNKPIVLVAYCVVKGSSREHTPRLFGTAKGHTEMTLTIIEQRLLETLFEDNGVYLSSFSDHLDELEDEDGEFTFGAILPLGPVAIQDLEWICQRNKCSKCQKIMTAEKLPYVYSDTQYCSQICENKAAQFYLGINKKEKAGQDPENPMFLPGGQFNTSYELEEAYFDNGFVDPGEKLERWDMIWILRGMKINIPPWTQFSANKLEAKLKLALDAAQRYSNLFQGAARVEVDLFPIWDENASSLSKAFDLPERKPLVEVEEKMETAMLSICGFLSKFIKRREVEGVDTAVFIDAENFRALVIKIVYIYAVRETTPLLLIAYQVIHGLSCREDIIEEVESVKGPKGIVSISMPRFEQRLLQFYLEHNQDRLLANRTIPESVMGPINRLSKAGYEFGFILPLGDILPKELGVMNEFEGCKLCGETAKSRCGACQTVWYCSKDCQTIDWKKHKPFCRSVASGTWDTIKLSPNPSTLSGSKCYESTEHAPENIYSDRYYLLKFHRPTGKGSKQSMLVCDVAKSSRLYFCKTDNRRVFEHAVRVLDGNSDRRVMYRWVKRIGDWDWKICLDCAPEVKPTW